MAKRANNEGTLYFREDRKRWCAQVSLDGRRLTKYAKTQAECRDWIKETIKKIDRGLTFEGTQVTFEHFVATWLDGKALSRRPRTVFQYRKMASDHILPAMGKMRLQEIQPSISGNCIPERKRKVEVPERCNICMPYSIVR